MTDRDDRRPLDERMLDELLATDVVWVEPPPELEDDVVDAVLRHRDDDDPATTTRPWRIATAVAGLVAVVASVVAALSLTADPPARTFDSVHELTATAAGAVAGDATPTLEVTATGSGTRLILDLAGVPPAAGDEVYEGWMLDDDGRAVSAGTFHMRGVDGPVWLWTGVSPDDFDVFVITRHPIDATAPPDGADDRAVVLRASLRP